MYLIHLQQYILFHIQLLYILFTLNGSTFWHDSVWLFHIQLQYILFDCLTF